MSNSVALTLEIAVALAASYPLLSLTEWGLHRYWMHGRKWWAPGMFERHALLHHGRWYKSFDREPDPAAKYVGVVVSPAENLLVVAPPLALLGLAGFPAAALTLAACVLAHALVWNTFHAEMHEPRGRWFARTRYYRWLCDYHRRHHERPGKNFNAVCPLADWLLGTLARRGAT